MSAEARSEGRDVAGEVRPSGRTLVAGWFSFFHGEATAGDLLAGETVSGWLADAGVDHDVAFSPVFDRGVDLSTVHPGGYDRLVFVCGPATGGQVHDLLDRFAHCATVAVGVSVLDETVERFDAVIERDSGARTRPDLAAGAPSADLPPVVAVVRSHGQPEYGPGGHQRAHALIDAVLADHGAAVIELGTRVDPREVVGRTSLAVEAALACVDAVVTTRLHGLVLALRRGVPAVAIDPIPGGAKVSRQARKLAWPAIGVVDEIDGDALRAHLDWALTEEARHLAHQRGTDARQALDGVRIETLRALGRLIPT